MSNSGDDAEKMSVGGGSDDIKGKGPSQRSRWTPEEDAILLEHVRKYNKVHRDWKEIQKRSELDRSWKSCKERWTSYLEPQYLREAQAEGLLTEDEEHKVVQLHAQIGNNWARIVQELTGRTDNEIKNYWDRRVKRVQQGELPQLYPADICPKGLDTSGSSQYPDSLGDQYDLSDIYKTYNPNYDINTMNPSNSKHLWESRISSAVPIIDQPGIHAGLKGNTCTDSSVPSGAMMKELPLLQKLETPQGSSGTSAFPLPSDEITQDGKDQSGPK